MKKRRLLYPRLIVLTCVLSSVTLTSCQECYTNVTSCVSLGNITSCLGTSLTFTSTSLVLATDSNSLSEVASKLDQWHLLRNVPECWAVIQPFLCSVYLPKCDGSGQVESPSRDLCQRTREPCKVVESVVDQWPDFLQCSYSHFVDSSGNCPLTYYETASFNTTSSCNAPLIRTSDSDSWYEDVKGCGIQCQNPLYSDSEHDAVHIFIAVFGSICIACTLFTLLTFIVDWRNASRYPALILFFINGCFFLGSIGWMAQFSGNARDDIVCRADGTVRKGEPQLGNGETASCTVVFLLVYYFMMAGIVWFVMLAYAWDITFKAIGTVRDSLSKKTAYFHIISWCLPLVLTIVCLAISEVDGDSVSGICFVGHFKSGIRAGFVLAPVGLVLIVGMIFLVRGLITLVKVRKDSPEFINDRATSKIRGTIIRLGTFTLLALGFVIITFSVHLYTFTNEEKWSQSFKDYIYCQADVALASNTTESPVCTIEDRPSLAAAIVHVFAFFGAGIAMSSWSWTKASLEAWERFFRKVFNKPSNKPVKLKKHKMIAKTFQHRKELNNGRLSLSYGSSHDDPLGMKFDMNSVSSHSMSSTFQAAVANRLMRRRGGFQHPVAGTLRRYSDSDISSVVSKMSKKSRRRQSWESSMSRKISDAERDIQEQEQKRKKKRKKRRKKRTTVQPVLEPISSQLAAICAAGGRRKGMVDAKLARCNSDTSLSKASAQSIRVALEKKNLEGLSLSSSQILSDSVTTNDSLDGTVLPQPKQIPNYSMFTASSFIPVSSKDEKGDNSNANKGNNSNSSPHGSFRRGRRREVKLEMTETSFYQDDEESVEINGSKTVHRQQECHEEGVIGTMPENDTDSKTEGHFKRFGSTSSKGSKGKDNKDNASFGSKTNIADIVSDFVSGERLHSGSSRGSRSRDPGRDVPPSGLGSGKRPWQGQVVNTQAENKIGSALSNSSRSQSSRVGSGSSRTRQLPSEGRIGSGSSNASWSRHFQPENQSDRKGSGNSITSASRKRTFKDRNSSAGSRSSNRSNIYKGDGRIGSGSSHGSRSRMEGVKIGSASSKTSTVQHIIDPDPILPDVEGDVMLDLIDYDDDLTEVSSLP